MEMYSWEVPIVVINSLLASVSLFTNTLTLVAIFKTRALQTVPNMYITSLTVVDLLSIAINISMVLFHLPYTRSIFQEKYVCLTMFAITYIISAKSVAMMTIIALDRFLAIRFPFKYEEYATKGRALGVIIFIWIFGFLAGVPVYFDNKWDEFNKECTYLVAFTDGRQYHFIVGYVFATVSTIYFYGYISYVTVKQRRIIRQQHMSSSTFKTGRKSILLYFIAFCTFTVCWSPCQTCTFVAMLGIPVTIPQVHYTFTIGMFNSSFNFLVYGIYNKDFRKAYKKLFHVNE